MRVQVACCLFAMSMCVWLAHGHDVDKVNVTVYYESLCPDSKKFFTSQLYPTLLQKELAKWVNLTLVPFGKSQQKQTGSGEWQFECHHGAYECQGNKLHVCAIHEIEKRLPTPPDSGFNPTTVALINCLMDKVTKRSDPNEGTIYDFPLESCSKINNVPQYVDIENCSKHPDGVKYLADMGNLTMMLQPPLSSVPTIVFNQQYKAADVSLAQSNFTKALCQYITHDKPSECTSSASTLTVSALVLVLVAAKRLL